jgi:fructose-bisphosphate aldolase class II
MVAQAQAVVQIHDLFRSPAILQGADLANGFMGGCTDFLHATLEDKQKGAANIAKAVQAAAATTSIPIALHLDHGKDIESVKAAIDGGYSSVMIDGSSLPLEQNIALTREVVKLAHAVGVTVEGELGVLSGVEDHVFSEHSTYTHPLDAIRFFRETKVDALAISYGTMHGANKGKDARVRKEIAIAIKECLRHEGIFGVLVSHGSSTVPAYLVDAINTLGGNITNAYGISLEQLKEVGKLGIGKINVDTDIRLAVTRNLRELFLLKPELTEDPRLNRMYQLLKAKPEAFDPRVFLPPIMDTVMYGTIPNQATDLVVNAVKQGVMEMVGTLIVEFGCVGKAPLVEQVTLEQMADRYRKEGI